MLGKICTIKYIIEAEFITIFVACYLKCRSWWQLGWEQWMTTVTSNKKYFFKNSVSLSVWYQQI